MSKSGFGEIFVMLSLLIGNFFYSVSKKSLPITNIHLETKMNATTVDLGNISSAFSASYGISKLLGGILSDVLPPYHLFCVGLYLAGILNLAILFAVDIPTIYILWAINGLGQGVGGPALSKLVVQFFPTKVRSSTWGNLSFACNLGYVLAPILLSYFNRTERWKDVFLVTGVSCLTAAAAMSLTHRLFLQHNPKLFYLTKTLLSTPAPLLDSKKQKTSLHITTKSHQEEQNEVQKDLTTAIKADNKCELTSNNNNKTSSSQDWEHEENVIKIPTSQLVRLVVKFLVLLLASILTYFVSKGIQDWIGQYLVRYLRYPADEELQLLAASATRFSSSFPPPHRSQKSWWTWLPNPLDIIPGTSNRSQKSWWTWLPNALDMIPGMGLGAPDMQIWELVLWPELGGMIGSVLVGALADVLHDRKSLACAMFSALCVAGLWGLALHLPLDSTAAAVHYMPETYRSSPFPHSYSIDYQHENIDETVLSASSTGTCLNPIDVDGEGSLCRAVNSTEIIHPLVQCQSVLLNTISIMFPHAGTRSLILHRIAMAISRVFLGAFGGLFTFNPYFSMRCTLFLIGMGINGPKTLVSMELMETVPARLCGTLTGVAGVFAQLGATYAGRFIALTIVQEGWCSFVALLLVSSVILTILLLLSALL